MYDTLLEWPVRLVEIDRPILRESSISGLTTPASSVDRPVGVFIRFTLSKSEIYLWTSLLYLSETYLSSNKFWSLCGNGELSWFNTTDENLYLIR